MRHLTDWLDGYMEYVDNTEPSPLYHQWCAVSTIAAVLQRKCFIQYGSQTYHSNFYIVLSGPTGASKSTALDLARDILINTQLPLKIAPESTTRESLIKILDESYAMYSDDSGTVYNHRSLNIHADELALFIGAKNIALIRDLTSLYYCRSRWEYRTKNSGDNIMQNVWVNLIGCITPELIQASFPPEAIGGGFAGRIIFVYAPAKYKIVVSPFLSNSLREKLIIDLQEIAGITGNYKPTRAFIAEYSGWYSVQHLTPPFEDIRFAGYLSRRQEFIWKLSMICAASRHNKLVIDADDFNRALDLLETVEQVMTAALTGVGSSETAWSVGVMEEFIMRKGTVTRAELMNRFRHDITKEQLDAVLSALELAGKCTLWSSGKVVAVKGDEKA
jgi:hypothetical protein